MYLFNQWSIIGSIMRIDKMIVVVPTSIQWKLDCSFNMNDSNSYFESLRNSSDSSRKQIHRGIFLFYHEIVMRTFNIPLL